MIINFILSFFFTIESSFSQKKISDGINLTGLERSWTKKELVDLNKIRWELRKLINNGYKYVRIPIDISKFLQDKKNTNSQKQLNHITELARKNNTVLIFSYFNHKLNHENYSYKADEIAGNWLEFLAILKGSLNHIYLDIANEPGIYPNEWEQAAKHIIKIVRRSYPDTKIIYGASNFNSLYELSRSQPLVEENIIYAFHFYEPYIFTHQGTVWTCNQNATTGIPFPYPDNPNKMPNLAAAAIGTPGEINYRDYKQTGTNMAIWDKIGIIANWAKKYNIELWCTEFGVTKNADTTSRKKYLTQVSKVLQEKNIKGFIWEYKGNFGIKPLFWK